MFLEEQDNPGCYLESGHLVIDKLIHACLQDLQTLIFQIMSGLRRLNEVSQYIFVLLHRVPQGFAGLCRSPNGTFSFLFFWHPKLVLSRHHLEKASVLKHRWCSGM